MIVMIENEPHDVYDKWVGVLVSRQASLKCLSMDLLPDCSPL